MAGLSRHVRFSRSLVVRPFHHRRCHVHPHGLALPHLQRAIGDGVPDLSGCRARAPCGRGLDCGGGTGVRSGRILRSGPMSESVPGLLTPVEYQLLAAPALQAAAEVAAQRGDPHLYNDMASMLALLGTVTALTHAYLQQPLPADSSPHEVLEIAPLSVCAL